MRLTHFTGLIFSVVLVKGVMRWMESRNSSSKCKAPVLPKRSRVRGRTKRFDERNSHNSHVKFQRRRICTVGQVPIMNIPQWSQLCGEVSTSTEFLEKFRIADEKKETEKVELAARKVAREKKKAEKEAEKAAKDAEKKRKRRFRKIMSEYPSIPKSKDIHSFKKKK